MVVVASEHTDTCAAFPHESIFHLSPSLLVRGLRLCGRSGSLCVPFRCGLRLSRAARRTSFLPRVSGLRPCRFRLWAVALCARLSVCLLAFRLRWRVFCPQRIAAGLLEIRFRILCRLFSSSRVWAAFAVFLSSSHLLAIVLCKMYMHNT
jgi:hypothetical protein